MKAWRPLTLAAVVSVVIAASLPARADDAPTFADRADPAFDDVERRFGLLLDPAAMAQGIFGAEVDVTVWSRAALAVEGDVFQLASGRASGALALGLPVYPFARVYHGLLVEPRALYVRPLRERLTEADFRRDVVALGGTAGWQWTWDYGLSVRLGAGAMKLFGGTAAPGVAVGRGTVDVVLDGSIGWLF